MTAPLLLVSILITAIGAVTFGYLYRQSAERYLLLWAAAFGLWLVRYVYALTVGTIWTGSVDLVVQALALGRTLLILAGTLELTGRPFSKGWLLVVAADGLWLGVDWLSGGMGRYTSVPHYLLLGLMLVWAGVAFIRSERMVGGERYMAGLGLILMGLHQADFPFLAPFEALRPWGIAAQHGFMILAIFGVLLAYLRFRSEQLKQAHAELEAALTTVIGGSVPMCAHCKSMRSADGRWEPIDPLSAFEADH